MKCHRRIRHDCFWPSRCDFEETPGLFHDFIANEIKISFLRLVNDFFVRERSLCRRVPIDHPASAIDQAFVIKIDKDVLDSASISVIECIPLARPVA